MSTPINIIFDNDLGGDIDGFSAYNLLHVLQERGLVNILAVIGNYDDKVGTSQVAQGIDSVAYFYGHTPVPIGLPIDAASKGPLNTSYASSTALWNYFPIGSNYGTSAEDSNLVYGRALEGAADGSVVILTTGHMNTLAMFMYSTHNGKTGIEWINQKCSKLVIGAGIFPIDTEEVTNFTYDPPSAHWVADNLGSITVPVLFIGESVMGATTDEDYTSGGDHDNFNIAKQHIATNDPMALWRHAGENLESNDVARVLFAVFGYDPYYEESDPGTLAVNAETGHTAWTAEVEGSNQTYLVSGPSASRYLVQIWAAKLLLNWPSSIPNDSRCIGAWVAPGWTYEAAPSIIVDTSTRTAPTSPNWCAQPANHNMIKSGSPIHLGGGVLIFPTSADYYEAACTEDNQYGSGALNFALIADIYIWDKSDTSQKVFISKSRGATDLSWSLGKNNGSLEFRHYIGGGTTLTLSAATALACGWNRIAIARYYKKDEGTDNVTYLLVNGEQDTETLVTPYASITNGAGYRLRLNGCPWYTASPGDLAANAPIGMVRIYDRPINQQELFNWLDRNIPISNRNVRRGVDRGDGVVGTLSPDFAF